MAEALSRHTYHKSAKAYSANPVDLPSQSTKLTLNEFQQCTTLKTVRNVSPFHQFQSDHQLVASTGLRSVHTILSRPRTHA